jgi:hypothetical protein
MKVSIMEISHSRLTGVRWAEERTEAHECIRARDGFDLVAITPLELF